MYDFEYCAAWPDELKELSARRYRAYCKARCLQKYLDRVDPDEFDAVMDALEATQREVRELAGAFMHARYQWMQATQAQ